MNQNCLCPNATANIKGGKSTPDISGQVSFYQKRNHVLIKANISGLPCAHSGFFGFHIHEGKSCSGEGFEGTANHYNPTNAPHPYHDGDLPPLMLCNGGACMVVATDRFSIKDIIGRTVVIHSMPDDFNTQPSGNAGAKIACGVITIRTSPSA